jgi:protein-S-isoprenylcysteine O-methyltransferase Ste14
MHEFRALPVRGDNGAMNLLSAYIIGPLFGLSELSLSLLKRSRGGATRADAGSLRAIWLVVLAALVLAALADFYVPAAASPLLEGLRRWAVGIFIAGLALRWYAVWYLGSLFTVDVAIAADHRLIDTGPYRYVRHPSYSGVLLEFLGLGLAYANWLSLVLLMLPVGLVFARRMRVEEAALIGALGGVYAQYMTRTRRLIPGIY